MNSVLIIVTLVGSSGQYQYPVHMKVANLAKAKQIATSATGDRAVRAEEQ